jgi:hypothetical protein
MKSWGNGSGLVQSYYKTFILKKKEDIAKMSNPSEGVKKLKCPQKITPGP